MQVMHVVAEHGGVTLHAHDGGYSTGFQEQPPSPLRVAGKEQRDRSHRCTTTCLGKQGAHNRQGWRGRDTVDKAGGNNGGG